MSFLTAIKTHLTAFFATLYAYFVRPTAPTSERIVILLRDLSIFQNAALVLDATELIGVNNSKLTGAMSQQLTLGSTLLNFLAAAPALTTVLEKALTAYTGASALLRAPLYTYMAGSRMDPAGASRELFHATVVKYVTEDLKISEALRSQLYRLSQDAPRYTELYTYKENIIFEFHIAPQPDADLYGQALGEMITHCVLKGSKAFSICYEKDVVSVRLAFLNGVDSVSLGGEYAVRALDGHIDLRSLTFFSEAVNSKLQAVLTKEGQSYTPFQESGGFLLFLHVDGIQRSESYFRAKEIKQITKAKVILFVDHDLLQTMYVPYHMQKIPAYTTTENNNTVVSTSFTKQYSHVLRTYHAPSLVPGGRMPYLSGTSLRTPLMPRLLARTVPLGIVLPTRQLLTNILDFDATVSRFLHPVSPKQIAYYAPSTKNESFPPLASSKRFFSSRATSSGLGARFLKGLQLNTTSTARVSQQLVSLAVFDFETITVNNTLVPYMAGVYHDGRYTCFSTADITRSNELVCRPLAEYIIDHLGTKNYTIAAHNLMNFDALFLLPALFHVLRERAAARFEDTPEDLFYFTQNETDLISFELTKPYNLRFIDSLRFLPMSLDTAGKAFVGAGKTVLGKASHEYTLMDLQNPTTFAALQTYNRTDCVLLYRVLTYFQAHIKARFNVSPLVKRVTLPGLSYEIFRTVTPRLENYHMVVPPRKFIPLIRASYRGGRCEVLHHAALATPTRGIHFLDFISLYPAISYSFPTPSGYILTATNDDLEEWELPFGIYLCKITCMNCPETHLNIPFLPLRLETDTTYPTGSWYSCYTSVEINYARELGYYDITPLSGHTYERCSYPFDEYTRGIYEWKQQAELTNNRGQRLLAKHLLNNLLGKFGQKSSDVTSTIQRTVRTTEYMSTQQKENSKHISTFQRRTLDDDYSLVTFSRESEDDKSTAAPQVSAFITAHGRILIHKTMCELTRHGCHVLYVDTDAVAFEASPEFDLTAFNDVIISWYERRINGTALGLVAPVYRNQTIVEMRVVAPKIYSIRTDDDNFFLKTAGFQQCAIANEQAPSSKQKLAALYVNKAAAERTLAERFLPGGRASAQTALEQVLLQIEHTFASYARYRNWLELEELKNRNPSSDAATTIDVRPKLVRLLSSFGVNQAPAAKRKVLLGARAQVKRQFLFNTAGNYRTTRPVRVEMRGSRLSKNLAFVATNRPLHRRWFLRYPQPLERGIRR